MTPVEALEAQALATAGSGETSSLPRKARVPKPRRRFGDGPLMPEYFDDAVRARGRELVEKGYAILDKQLEGREWIAGSYSIADSAVFYVSFWWNGRLKKELPANVAAHYGRMKARPAVHRTLEQEGLAA